MVLFPSDGLTPGRCHEYMQISGKKGGTPKKKDVCFLTPDGEEVKNKRQLDKYLKAHPGTLTAADFDWGIPGWLYIFFLPCWSGCVYSRWFTQQWSSLDCSLCLLLHMLLKDVVSSFCFNMKINLAIWHLGKGTLSSFQPTAPFLLHVTLA